MDKDVVYKEVQIDGSTKSILRIVASNESEDGHGDVVRAEGWDLRRFKRNPIILFGHDHMLPIGISTKQVIANRALTIDIKLADEGTSDFIDTVRKLVDQKILRGASVGFRATMPPSPRRDKDGDFCGFEFNGTELLETSLVTVPANPETLAIAKSLNCSNLVMQRLFAKDALVQVATRARMISLKKLGATSVS